MSRLDESLDNVVKVGILTSNFDYEEHTVDYIDYKTGMYQLFKDSKLIAEYNQQYIIKIHYHFS